MGSSDIQTTISPIDQSPVHEEKYSTPGEVDQAVEKAFEVQKIWRRVSLKDRIAVVTKLVDEIVAQKDDIANELTREMGRPIRSGGGELKGFEERARYLISVAESSLADTPLTGTDKPGLTRWIRKEPVGVCVLIGAWNFPYMIIVNSLIPSLLSGNSVILKPSPQTPSSYIRLSTTLSKVFSSPEFSSFALSPSLSQSKSADQHTKAPSTLFIRKLLQTLHLKPEEMDRLVANEKVGFVSFTGSVGNGRRVERNARGGEKGGFKHVGLELGGKDPAFVREDADLVYAAGEIADGAFFNSGQSCCSIERCYVHEKVWDKFVEEIVKVAKGYLLGDPRKEETTLGPVISLKSAETIRSHISDAVSKGAKLLVPEDLFPNSKEGTTYVSPQVLVNVNHGMKIMTDETFGPVLPIQKVSSDAEALNLMNDSPYGLTASIWTQDAAKFEELVPEVDAGTVFMNRADYLDPALCWTGIKESGRGISLSKLGFDQVTQVKSVHRKTLE